jgi:hypothetical protein
VLAFRVDIVTDESDDDLAFTASDWDDHVNHSVGTTLDWGMIEKTFNALWTGEGLPPPCGTPGNPHVTWAAGHPYHRICGECGADLR